MFTSSDQPGLLFAFFAILVPATGLFMRYTTTTRFWINPAGKAFFLFISTSWLNYIITAASVMWPDWAASAVGVDVRIVSRALIAIALCYSWFVFERARKTGRPQSGFTGTGRNDTKVEMEAYDNGENTGPAGW